MGMSINYNSAAQNAYRNLSMTQSKLNGSLEKLSSGLRINRAADDAAGLAISEGLRSQVSGLQVAVRNSQDGISVVQTAEGALNEVHSMLHRIRDLAVQSANGSNNQQSRDAIQTEVTGLVSELNRIADTTNFNGTKLLNGSASTLNFQVGADSGDTIGVDLSQADLKGIMTTLAGGSGPSGESYAIADATAVTGNQVFTVTDANGSSTAVTVKLGAAGDYQSLQAVADALNGDTGFSANLTASVNSSTGNLDVMTKAAGLTITDANAGTGVAKVGTIAASTTSLDLSTQSGASSALGTLDTAINAVSTARAALGAVQNRFDHTINNLNVTIENLSASDSRIRDTDMAQEMVNFTQSQILSQAGTAMLAQANQANAGILTLLRG